MAALFYGAVYGLGVWCVLKGWKLVSRECAFLKISVELEEGVLNRRVCVWAVKASLGNKYYVSFFRFKKLASPAHLSYQSMHEGS